MIKLEYPGDPTVYQRITWAMQQLKNPEAKTNFFKEFYRFLSTPFYGDLQLLKECEKIKTNEVPVNMHTSYYQMYLRFPQVK